MKTCSINPVDLGLKKENDEAPLLIAVSG